MERTAEPLDIEVNDVSATLFVTLYCHALESQSQNPILVDPMSVELVQKFNEKLSHSDNNLFRRLARGKLDKNLIVHIAIRAKKYDEYVSYFLNHSPAGVVVNIGCGMDTRFWRIDNGRTSFYDLDLPEVISIKKKLMAENERYHFIGCDVLDHDWMAILGRHGRGPYLFVAEGVFMYLHDQDVKSLVLKLQSQYPGSELVCEVFNEVWLGKPFLKKIIDFKMQKELHLGSGATFNFGIRSSEEMETWNSGIQFLDDWSYFDADEEKLGWLRLFRRFQLFRKTQWTVHYRLNQACPLCFCATRPG